MDQQHTFPKIERLSSKKVIDQLFENGRTLDEPPFVVKYQIGPLPEEAACQLAVSVPKRRFKSAVKRNLIKRVVKEAYRIQKSNFVRYLKEEKLQCAIFLIYNRNTMIEHDEAEQKIILILQRLQEYCGQLKNQT